MAAGKKRGGRGKKKRALVQKARRRLWIGRALLLFALGLAVLAAQLWWFARQAGSHDLSRLAEVPERTQVYDCRGRLIGSLHGENRVFVPLSEVSPYFIDALLAREDSRFYRHRGVDWFGVVRAAVRNVREGGVVQGGSTITMQLARNRYPLGGRTFGRKVVEAMVARRLESRYSKDQILEAYVNVIYFGSGQYGLEQASRAYFEKSARDLNLPEAAMLAGLIRSPNNFSPFRDLDAARGEMAEVLDRMAATRRLEKDRAEAAKRAVPRVRPPERRFINDTWAMDIVRRELSRLLDPEDIARGGLRVFTTLDLDIQTAAERELEEQLAAVESRPGYTRQTRVDYAEILARTPEGESPPAPQYLQGAVVVVDHFSGGIRAMVGGRTPQHSRFNRAWQAERQVGSLFKPFVFTAAWQRGMTPASRVDDGPLRPGEIAGASRGWSPRNADRTHQGMQTAAWGLQRSRNTMSVRVGNHVGLTVARQVARDARLTDSPPAFPSLYLGAFESTVREVTNAYAVFPRGGTWARPFVINEIQERDGTALFRSGVMALPVFSEAAARTTTSVLQGVMAPGGTGAAVAGMGVNYPVAGKTGTTDGFRDAWFVGYNSLLTGGVWVGYDMARHGVPGGYGSQLALPVWAGVMNAARDAGYLFGELP